MLARVIATIDPPPSGAEGRAAAAVASAESLLQVERHLERMFESLHERQVDEIRRGDIKAVLDEVARTSGKTSADRAKASISTFFAWLIAERELVETNPCVGIRNSVTDGARDRVLREQELVTIWRACLDDDYGAIVKLLLLTGQRREELGALQWNELHENGDGVHIELDGQRTKNGKAHLIPLAPEAVALLPARREGPYVFGRFGTSPFSGWSWAKRALDERAADLAPWRLHDLRRSVVTHLGESRKRIVETSDGPRQETWCFAQPHVIEMLVNHISGQSGAV